MFLRRRFVLILLFSSISLALHANEPSSSTASASTSIMVESALDERFHTLEEINYLLDSLAADSSYSSILRIFEIGQSTNDHLPIRAIKLSNNPDVAEDEPAVLFLGQCHAEEVLGVEITLGLLNKVLTGYSNGNTRVTAWLANTEIYIVPTYNPEGLTVVHDGLDVTYRKNFTDANGNGTFDYWDGIGYDEDGIDLNRNYDFNWLHGDGYLVGDYDYFRGFEAFSETETQAIRDLALSKNFVFSVSYHSARSGTPEIVYYPWNWGNIKKSPDYEHIYQLAARVSELIINEAGDGHYHLAAGNTLRGKAPDWFYSQTGSIQFLIEVGTHNLQPDSLIIEDTVTRNLVACTFIIDRAMGYPGVSKAQITGIITDASDNVELQGATVQIEKLQLDGTYIPQEGGMMKPRTTDIFGRYRRILIPGAYRVIVDAPGYMADSLSQIPVSDNYITPVDMALVPYPIHEFALTLSDDSQSYLVVWDDDEGLDSLTLTPGNYAFNRRTDKAKVSIFADGYFPQTHVLTGTPGYVQTLNMQLNPALSLFLEPFNDLSNWTSLGGDWLVEWSILKTQSTLFYSDEVRDDFIYSPAINLPVDAEQVAIKINHKYEMEWADDSIYVVVKSLVGGIVAEKKYDGHDFDFHDDWIVITDSLPSAIQLFLQFKCDEKVGYRGWHINSLEVYSSNQAYVSIDDQKEARQSEKIIRGHLSGINPNPARNFTRVHYALPDQEMLHIAVYNIVGQQIYTHQFIAPKGQHYWQWNGLDQSGNSVSTGVYIVQVKGESFTNQQKVFFYK